MKEAPLVRPFDFTIGRTVYSFQDLRFVSPKLRISTLSIQQESIITLYPREILCSSNYSRALDSQRVQSVSRGDKKLLAQNIEMYKEIDAQRHSLEFFLGDISPITFSIFVKNKLWGAWQWYGIYKEEENDLETKVNAGWFPAYPVQLPVADLVKISIDMVHAFLDTELQLGDGRILTVVKATAPILTRTDREDTAIIADLKTHLLERGEITVEIIDEGDRQEGREAVTLVNRQAQVQVNASR